MKISEIIKNCGVVGAGGAGFPTHVKLKAKADTVIVNGAECEPLLASDKYLMETESDKIVRGLEYIMEACEAKKGFIALKEKYSLPLRSISTTTREKDDIDIFPLEDFYPAGDEYILVNEVTGRIVPEGGIPPQVGCVVDNIETVVNIFEAVQSNKPVTKRFLTCAGEVVRPSVIKAHIGTPINEIIELCGGATVDDFVVVIGGPLMGTVETDLATPVDKTMSGIIVLPRTHEVVKKKTIPFEFIIKQSKSVCCQCTLCTELCPRHLLGHGLQPHMIMRQISYGIDVPSKTIENAFLCSGCGLCEIYGCVMDLSPNIINTKIKEKFILEKFKPQFPEKEIAVNEMRDYRKIPTARIVERLRLSKYESGYESGYETGYETGYESDTLRRGIETNPGRVEILLKQHTGEQSFPVVKVGDKVSAGSLIADVPDDALGAKVHSSIDGRVSLIDEERIIIEK